MRASFALLLVSFLSVQASGAPLFSCSTLLEVAPNLSYSVPGPATSDPEAWLSGGDIAVRLGGSWHTLSAGTLVATASNETSGDDALRGPWTRLTVSLVMSSAPATPVEAAFTCYGSGASVAFTLSYPLGASGAATSPCPPTDPSPMFNSSTSPTARFPSFCADAATRLGGRLAFLEWLGDWAFEQNTVTVGLAANFTGGQASGPLVLWDHTPGAPLLHKPAALVLSSGNRFRSTILGLQPAVGAAVPGSLALGAGSSGYVDSLPRGYSQEVLLVASPDGIGDAMARWGDALQRARNTTRLPPEQDVWTSHLTYFTSNGAFYSDTWFALHGANTTGEAVLRELHAYHAAAGIPVAAFELDPWWMPCGTGGENGGSPEDWAPRADLFPHGLEPLAADGFVFMLYGAYWALPGANRLSPPWTFDVSQVMPSGPAHIAGIAANESRAFYTALIARGAAWGLRGIETDWIMKDIAGFTALQTDVDAMDAWWSGAADAALAAGVPWQLCLQWAADVLMALDHPAVTHIRVSIDNEPLHFPHRWRTGQSAMLHGALAVRPFSDVVLTSTPQPGLPYAWNPQGDTGYPELALLNAALSTGPVGLGDGVGFTNVTLALSTCASDGVLLQPSSPATALDDQYVLDVGAGSAVSPQGTVHQAHAYIPSRASAGTRAVTAHHFATALAVDVARQRSLHPESFFPPLRGPNAGSPLFVPYARALTLGRADSLSLLPARNDTHLVLRWRAGLSVIASACAHGARASSCAEAFSPAAQLDVVTGSGGGAADPFTHQLELFSLAPALPSGWALLGEVRKAVRVAPARFLWLDDDAAAGPSFAVRVARSERVEVVLLAPSAPRADPLLGTVVVVEITGGSDGGGVVLVECSTTVAPQCVVSMS